MVFKQVNLLEVGDLIITGWSEEPDSIITKVIVNEAENWTETEYRSHSHLDSPGVYTIPFGSRITPYNTMIRIR